jgi:thiol:disulfide interchange protein DsbD
MSTLLRVWVLAMAAWTGGAAAAKDAELLDPEVAFRFSAQLLSSSSIEVHYVIVDGYYLYRDRFHFQLSPGEGNAEAIKYPAGKIKRDPLFGKVETYRKSVRIIVPIDAAHAGGTISLTAISQGCADAGVCYTPMTSQINLDTATIADRSAKPSSSLLKK